MRVWLHWAPKTHALSGCVCRSTRHSTVPHCSTPPALVTLSSKVDDGKKSKTSIFDDLDDSNDDPLFDSSPKKSEPPPAKTKTPVSGPIALHSVMSLCCAGCGTQRTLAMSCCARSHLAQTLEITAPLTPMLCAGGQASGCKRKQKEEGHVDVRRR